MRISDWSSDVCSSDLDFVLPLPLALALPQALAFVSSLFFSGSWISPAILRSALQTFARLWVWARGLPLLAAALKTLGSSGSSRSTRCSRAFWKSARDRVVQGKRV